MSVIDYQSGHRIDDADENPSRERLRIRREIQLSLIAHAGESVADVEYRKREKATAAEAALAPKRRLDTRPAQNDRDGMRWSEFTPWFEQYIDEYSDILEDGIIKTVVKARREARDRTQAAEAEIKAIKAEVAALKERVVAAPGKLPAVKFWTKDCVAYEGELFSDGRNLFQARQNTGQQPGGPHWTCVARGADSVALPLPNLPAPDFDEEANALRAEFAAGFEKASGDLAELEVRVTSLQAVDRERLVRIEDSVGRIRAEVRAEAHAEFETKLAEQERAVEAKIAAMAERLASTSGELPQVKNWMPQMICYRGQLFACDGALWQARKDTATAPAPDAADWTLIARGLERQRRRERERARRMDCDGFFQPVGHRYAQRPRVHLRARQPRCSRSVRRLDAARLSWAARQDRQAGTDGSERASRRACAEDCRLGN
jgi:hypothetical protein